jgi:CBS domain-containing protein
MGQKVHEVMTDHPVAVDPQATLAEAARLMRENDIGDVLVAEGNQLRGIVTDRDIVVRAVADGRDVRQTTVAEVTSVDVAAVSPDDEADEAVLIMRERSVRRIPVVDVDRLVGVVSLGDMALERDDRSVLAEISAAEPNH